MAPKNNLKPLDPEPMQLPPLRTIASIVAAIASVVVLFWAVAIYVISHFLMKFW